MVAYALEKATECPMCGTGSWEWEADPQAYEAALGHCPGCASKDLFRETLGEAARSPGASVNLVPHAVAVGKRQKPAQRPISPRERAGKKTKRRR